MGFFVPENQAVIWRGPMLHKALEQFITDVKWGEPDYLLIDMPPGTGDVSISMSQFLPRAEVIVVTTPQIAAQSVAQRAAAMSEKVELDLIGVIENMSWFRGDDGKAYEIFGSGGGKELADHLDVPLLGQVPLVTELRKGGDIGAPIVVTDPDSEAAQVFHQIAEQIEEIAPRKIYKKELRLIVSALTAGAHVPEARRDVRRSRSDPGARCWYRSSETRYAAMRSRVPSSTAT